MNTSYNTIEKLAEFAEGNNFELTDEQVEEAFDKLDEISEWEMSDKEYDELLDEAGTVTVGGLEFYPSYVLKNCDPTAYNCGKNDMSDDAYEFDGNKYEDYDSAVVALLESVQ